ncbi:MAG: response regulator [Betaproteobacteria bacterium]|nr:response regulator [Betaproteobacteria bacterium]
MPHHPTPRDATVLVVDDVPDNLLVVSDLLREAGYAVRAANSGAVALRYAAQPPQPDLILLDIMMPGMDGYEVLRRLREEQATAEIPVIFLSARGDDADQEHGLAAGAADYLSKPLRPLVALARVRAQIEARRARRMLREENRQLAHEVVEHMTEVALARRVGFRALAHLAELRDPETGNHILRTQAYVRELALELKRGSRHAAALDDHMLELLSESAPLHDIGKVGIPDHILLKPGPLTNEEMKVMRTHTTLGARAIAAAQEDIGHPVEFLTVAHQVALSHHERWDGSGYPHGLAGEQIPLAARIMSVADVFDALSSPRVYKRALGEDEAYRIIVAGAGTQFDPEIVEAFRTCHGRLLAIARTHIDVDPAVSA